MPATSLVYIASPLCSEAERVFNLRIRSYLREMGWDTYLPQEDGGLLSQLVRDGLDESIARQRLFREDLLALERCHTCLAVLDGRTIDEGVCFELGFAFSLGKRCVAFKTDSRSMIRGRDNLMIEGAITTTARSWQELDAMFARKDHDA